MSIDISTEAVVTLTQATHHLPRRRKGKRPAVSTVFRWAQHGCRGVRLETIQVGGTKCTSLEALQRFCERLSQEGLPKPNQTPARRRRAAEAAEQELERQGI